MDPTLAAYIPMDRRQALARGATLPDRTWGAALFADIAGFTPLTESLMSTLGVRRGGEELTHQLNRVYDALVAGDANAIVAWLITMPSWLAPL